MMLTIALATLRTRWVAFAGTLAALALGVSVIATMALVLAAANGGGGHRSPERFAAARFVIAADQDLRVRDAGGVDTVPLPEQPDVPASAVARLPDTAVDRSFYAQLAGVPAAQPPLGHGWSSAAFAPYRLSSGHPPRTNGEVVVAGRAALGRPVTVLTAGGPLSFTVVGTVQPRTGEQPIFFTDAEAARLSPGVDALVTDDPATARRAAALGLQVLTGAGRHQADPDAGQDSAELAGLTTFLGIAAAISAFVALAVIASAFGLSVAQRRRDLALLRIVGATPRQVARMVRAEAALVGVAGSALGCLLGVIWAPLLAGWIASRGLSPAWFSVQLTPGAVPALVIAFLAGVAVAVASVLMAARRAGRIGPTEALREAAVEPARVSPGRLLGGLGCLAAGVATLAAVALLFPSATSDAKTEAMIVLLLVGGAVLLAPRLVGPLTRPFGHGTAGMLIRAGVSAGPGRAAAAVVPALIAVGLSVSILGSSDTATAAADAGLQQQASAADYVVLPGAGTPGLSTALIDRIDAIGGLDATAVTQTTLLAHEPAITRFHLEAPMPIPFAAIGIDRASPALTLPVLAGSLANLGDHTIAVDTSWHERLGASMRLWLPDGTPVSLRVVAILAPGLSGVSLVVDTGNAGAVMPGAVYVRLRPGHVSAAVASLRAVARQADARVVPASRWSAAVSDQQNEQNQVGLELLLGIAIAYSAIGIAGTSLMSTSGRRGELALLRLTGATRRQIAWITAAESLALTFAAVAVAAAISGLVLGGLWVAYARAAGSTPIVLPWPLIAAIIGASALIGVAASTLPVLGSRR
jgi:putative ABC transport system permease protein